MKLAYYRRPLWRKSSDRRLPPQSEELEEVDQSQHLWRIPRPGPRSPPQPGGPATQRRTWRLTRMPSTELWD